LYCTAKTYEPGASLTPGLRVNVCGSRAPLDHKKPCWTRVLLADATGDRDAFALDEARPPWPCDNQDGSVSLADRHYLIHRGALEPLRAAVAGRRMSK